MLRQYQIVGFCPFTRSSSLENYEMGMRILLILVSIALSCCNCSHWSLYKTEGKGKMFAVSNHTRHKRDLNSLFIIPEPPKQFSGKPSDISQRVLRSKPGTVITNRGIPHVWRRKETRRDCYIQCQYEQLIACDYYYLFEEEHKCIMMEQDYGKVKPLTEKKEKEIADSILKSTDKPKLDQTRDKPKEAPLSADKPKVTSTTTEKPKVASTTTEQPNEIPKPVVQVEMAPSQTDKTKEIPMPTDQFHIAPMPTKHLDVAPMPRDRFDVAPMPRDRFDVAPMPTNQVNGAPMPTNQVNGAPMPTNQVNGAPMPTNQVNGAPLPRNSDEEREGIDELRRMIEKIESRLDTSINALHSDKASKEKLMVNLQAIETSVQNSISRLSDKVKVLDKVNPRIIEKVNTMHNKQEAIVGQVENMASYENEMATALTNIDRKVSELDGDLTAIKDVNDKISRQLSGEEMANPEFNRQIISLRRKMMDLTSRVEMNPTMTKMLKNQQVLSEALEAVDRELAVFERRQNRIEENTGDWGSRLIAEEQHRKTINDVLQSVTKAVKDVRKDVIRLQNPMSAENSEKTKEMRQMKSDIKILERSNAKLEQDVFHVRSDLTRLVKDLVNVQLSTYDSKNSIVALVEANKNLKLDYHQQKINQNQMITQIQTLSSVYRSVLSALHSLELKQIQVMHHLGKYENDVRRVSNDVLGNEKSQIIHNMPLITKMRKFQLQLLNQVNHLKRDLLKVHRRLRQNPPNRYQGRRRTHHRGTKPKWTHKRRKTYRTRTFSNTNRVNQNNQNTNVFNSRFINKGQSLARNLNVGPPLIRPTRPVGPPVKPTNTFQAGNFQRDQTGRGNVFSLLKQQNQKKTRPRFKSNRLKLTGLRNFVNGKNRGQWLSSFNKQLGVKKVLGKRPNLFKVRPNSFGVRPNLAFTQVKPKKPVLNVNIRNPDLETEEMINNL